ncbi:MAG: hypothetical protein R2742_15505 [Micropruina glycogenica]
MTGETEVIARLWQGSTAQDVRVRYARREGSDVTGLEGDSRTLTAGVPGDHECPPSCCLGQGTRGEALRAGPDALGEVARAAKPPKK